AAGDAAIAAEPDEAPAGAREDLVRDGGGLDVGDAVAHEHGVTTGGTRGAHRNALVVAERALVAEDGAPAAGLEAIRADLETGERGTVDEEIDQLLEAGREDGDRHAVHLAPAYQRHEARIDGHLGAEPRRSLGKGHPQRAHVARDRVAEREPLLPDQALRLPVALDAGAEVRHQELQRVRLRAP